MAWKPCTVTMDLLVFTASVSLCLTSQARHLLGLLSFRIEPRRRWCCSHPCSPYRVVGRTTCRTKIKVDEGNWFLLRFFGQDVRQGGFDWRGKSREGRETIKAVAAISYSFHRYFEAIRCSACKTSNTLGDFDAVESTDRGSRCFDCIDPRDSFIPVNRSHPEDNYIMVGDISIGIPSTADQIQMPTRFCFSHPACGRCRSDEQARMWKAQDDADSWSNGS
jgi:hypothetical protein